jgi:small subunit ribosomal protein S8
MDRFSDEINKIKTNERIGRRECIVASTKLMRTVLDLLKSESYISGYEEFTDKKFKMLRVKLANRINSIGVIKPRYAVQCADIQKYETRYIPSGNFGVLILSTPQGVMTNLQAKEKRTGGRLLAYVY